jgi:RNA polymerase sigma-70 factor, ECF subfamily
MSCMSPNHDGAGRTDTPGIESIDGLYGYAMSLTRNHAQAEDLVQETYVRAIPAMERLQADSKSKVTVASRKDDQAATKLNDKRW